MSLFLLTFQKLQGKGKQILAASSLLSFNTFLAFLPVIIGNPQTLRGLILLGVIGYVIIYLIFIPNLIIFAKLLEIEKTLFNDYAEWHYLFHWSVIVGSWIAIGILAIAILFSNNFKSKLLTKP